MQWVAYSINSNLLVVILTLIGAFLTYHIYASQIRKYKSDRARLILIEIRKAEDELKKIGHGTNNGANIVTDTTSHYFVLPTNTWKEFNYLFVSDFLPQEFEYLTDFYESCEYIQFLANKQESFFWITTEEKAKLIQSKHFEEWKTAVKEGKKFKEANEEIMNWMEFMANLTYSYAPKKLNEIVERAKQTKIVAGTTIDNKLSAIAYK